MKIIEEITKNFSSSSTMSEKYISKNYPFVYKQIMDYSSYLNLTFPERLYYFYNQIETEILCKTCKINRPPYENMKIGYRQYCCPKCSASNKDTKEKRKETVLEKYGVDNVSKNEDIKSKIEETNIERYGNKFSLVNEEVKKKSDDTKLEKYGTIHPLQNEEIKEKRNQTSLDNNGFIGFFENKEEFKKVNKEKYGKEYYTQTNEYNEDIKKKNQEKYGVDWYLQSDEFNEKFRTKENIESNIEKSKNTSLGKFGKEYYTQTDEYKERVKDNSNLLKVYDDISQGAKDKYKNIGFDFMGIKTHNNTLYITIKGDKCGHISFAPYTTINNRLKLGYDICTICNSTTKHSQSNAEREILKFIQDNYNSEIIARDRTLGIEIDIFIPELKLGFEYNGLYWHKDDKFRHKNKTDICEKNGIELIHIWEDNWLYKKDLVKSMILNRISNNQRKIRASKCEVKEIKSDIANDFLDINHIQGRTKTSIRLGLFLGDELVSLMCFSKNTRSITEENSIELIRFCSIRDSLVYGGGSKLFQYFLKTYPEYKKILSFCDRSIFNGNFYKKLGFENKGTNPIDYWWVVDDVRRNKQNFSKSKLIKKIGPTTDSESTIMYSLGYFKIWNCGLDKYIYTT